MTDRVVQPRVLNLKREWPWITRLGSDYRQMKNFIASLLGVLLLEGKNFFSLLQSVQTGFVVKPAFVGVGKAAVA